MSNCADKQGNQQKNLGNSRAKVIVQIIVFRAYLSLWYAVTFWPWLLNIWPQNGDVIMWETPDLNFQRPCVKLKTGTR